MRATFSFFRERIRVAVTSISSLGTLRWSGPSTDRSDLQMAADGTDPEDGALMYELESNCQRLLCTEGW